VNGCRLSMNGMRRTKHPSATAAHAAALVCVLVCVLLALGACTNTARFGGQPETAAAPPPPPPSAPEPAPTAPPPVDLAGKWRLSAAGGACTMTFTDEAGATDGKIAPAGGCPANFFMSRKWTYEQGALIVRDFKGQALTDLTFNSDHFEGKDADGGQIMLARP
jgi:hypothetical protein